MIIEGNRIGPDLILYNGKIVTVDLDFSVQQAVAVMDDKIVAVGDDGLKEMALSGTKVIDLKGKTMSPGMIDNHTHLLLADFTVYTDDIMSVPDEKIKDVKVAMTIVDGKIGYER